LTLLDTNVVIDAQNKGSPFYRWSNEVIVDALETGGAAINAIAFAELCAAENVKTENIESELARSGIEMLDLPARAANICGRAYLRYRKARKKSGAGRAPVILLPDFFIGAHAALMGWPLATRDPERFRLYFPGVQLIEPEQS
jgi:predicted nucleic acid-binding protein